MADNINVKDAAGATVPLKTKDTGAGHVGFKALADKNGVALDALPVTVPATDAYGSGTREYGVPTRQAVTATSTAFALPTLGASREIVLMSNTRLFFLTGTSGVIAAPAAAHPLAADERFHFRLPAGHTHIAFVQDAAGGFITYAAVV